MNRPTTIANPDSAYAWLMAAVAFVASFVVFGVIYSFGVFLKPMADEFHANATKASAFFSITALVYYTLGAFTGRLADRFGPRMIVTAGAIALGLGLCLTALTNDIWIGYLTYGIGVGIGAACCYVPTLAIVGGWFVQRRNSALGVAAAGTGCGTLVLAPLAGTLIQRYGWRESDVFFGLAATAILLGCAWVAKPPPASSASKSASVYPLRSIFRSREFVMLYTSWFLATTALFVPFVFLPAFARDHGASGVAAGALISVLGGASIVGRLALVPIGDRFAAVPMFKFAVLMMAISYAIWLVSSSYESLIVFVAVLGLGYGSRISLVPSVLIECFGLQNLGTMLGVFFTASGLSALLGPLLAGLFVDLTGSYKGAVLLAISTGVLGFVTIAPLSSGGQVERQRWTAP